MSLVCRFAWASQIPWWGIRLPICREPCMRYSWDQTQPLSAASYIQTPSCPLPTKLTCPHEERGMKRLPCDATQSAPQSTSPGATRIPSWQHSPWFFHWAPYALCMQGSTCRSWSLLGFLKWRRCSSQQWQTLQEPLHRWIHLSLHQGTASFKQRTLAHQRATPVSRQRERHLQYSYSGFLQT